MLLFGESWLDSSTLPIAKPLWLMLANKIHFPRSFSMAPSSSTRKSRFKHVAWRGGRAKPWQVMIQGTYVGSYALEEEAAKSAVAHLG